MLYDSKSGLLFWSPQRADGTAIPWTVAKAADERSLVGFYLQGANVTYGVSTTSAASLSDAESKTLEEFNNVIKSPHVYSTIRLEAPLKREFFFGQSSNPLGGEGKLRRVLGTVEGWQ